MMRDHDRRVLWQRHTDIRWFFAAIRELSAQRPRQRLNFSALNTARPGSQSFEASP